MTKKLFTNNARSTLAAGISAVDLVLSVQPGDGVLFPAPAGGQSFRLTLIDNLGNREIVDVSARVNDVCTITRGAEGTLPRAFGVNSKVSLRVTKETLEDMRDGVDLGTMAQQNANAVNITGGSIGGVAIQTGNVGPPVARGQIAGLTLANNGGSPANKVDIDSGVCRSSDDTNNIVLAAAFTKQLDAVWVLGTGNGMLASGAAIADVTYHLFAILRPDTGNVDIAADSDPNGANVAAHTNAAYTKIRRIGSVLREAGSIVAFVQDGDYFRRKASKLDVDLAVPNTNGTLVALSVPTGVHVDALMNVEHECPDPGAGSNASYAQISDPAANDELPGLAAPLGIAASIFVHGGDVFETPAMSRMRERTDTTAKIRYRVSVAGSRLRIATLGWFDRRGRDA